MPLFSVIIPVYNNEQYLKSCIDSVLAQAFDDFEIVIIDDGSTDQSAEICDAYVKQDSRIKVLHKINAGVSLARQDGVMMAEGEFLIFVDSDDRILDGLFEALSKHTDADIIRYGCYVEDSRGKVVPRVPNLREGFYCKSDIEAEIFPYLIQSISGRYYTPSLFCHCFRRSLFIENMVKDVVIKIGEDGACVMPCIYNAKTMFCLKECFYFYAFNPNSATKGRKAFPWDGPRLIAEHLLKRIDISWGDFKAQLYRKIVHELYLVVLSHFKSSKSYRKTVKEVKKELSHSIYKEAINNAVFKNSFKAKLMLWAFRHKFYFIFYIYSKI